MLENDVRGVAGALDEIDRQGEMKHRRARQQAIDMLAPQHRQPAPHDQGLEEPVAENEPPVVEQCRPRRRGVAVPPYVAVEPGNAGSFHDRTHILSIGGWQPPRASAAIGDSKGRQRWSVRVFAAGHHARA